MQVKYFNRFCSIFVVLLLIPGIMGCHGGDSEEQLPGTASDGQTLIAVPGGTFTMGSDVYPSERPPHRVTVSDFSIGKCEVTNAQYRAFCNATGRKFPPSAQGDDHPVVALSWSDAQAYCSYYGYTLPTEAQWEYAARGTAGSKWPWGEQMEEKCCNYYNKGPGGWTFPVGSFPEGASWCGVLDMAGNVWEWCADWFSYDYYGMSPTLNPRGPSSSYYGRVTRGGACNTDFDDCRTARRNYQPSDWGTLTIGFRVCKNGR